MLTSELAPAQPLLNLTVTPKPYTALLFNNCLDNGEPDERSLHEGLPPLSGVKYAINGWVRAKYLGAHRAGSPGREGSSI